MGCSPGAVQHAIGQLENAGLVEIMVSPRLKSAFTSQWFLLDTTKPIRPFIFDFVCFATRLIIELDGFTHGLEQNYNYDRYRHHWLESNGFRVLRYSDDDVRDDRGAVIDSIATVLEQMDG